MRQLSHITVIPALAVLAACGNETTVTRPLDISARRDVSSVTTRYEITKFSSSLGGTVSRGMAINSVGWVAGWSDLGDGHRHAALWRNGSIIDLGTLGGLSSTVPWPGMNDAGMIVGISQTTAVDPLDEDWSCELGAFLPETTNRICRGFVWENNVMRELPTLGGNHGFATGVNNKGLVVGWAETPVHDPTCSPSSSQVLQFRAVVWNPKDGSGGKIKSRELRPFRGDSTSAATAINDSGQVVGISGDCDQAVGRYSARHAVLWNRNGKVTEIPNLGGTSWHTPMDINANGDVVGFSNPAEPGDEVGDFISRAFLWIYGAATATDLKTLPGDFFSEAFAINSSRQVVGVSFGGANGSHAFIYENGVMQDLNDLVGPGFADILRSAQDINDAGQITGRVFETSTGRTLTFVATPIAEAP
jgi:probable HAF family extracellular repeat protein